MSDCWTIYQASPTKELLVSWPLPEILNRLSPKMTVPNLTGMAALA